MRTSPIIRLLSVGGLKCHALGSIVGHNRVLRHLMAHAASALSCIPATSLESKPYIVTALAVEVRGMLADEALSRAA